MWLGRLSFGRALRSGHWILRNLSTVLSCLLALFRALGRSRGLRCPLASRLPSWGLRSPLLGHLLHLLHPDRVDDMKLHVLLDGSAYRLRRHRAHWPHLRLAHWLGVLRVAPFIRIQPVPANFDMRGVVVHNLLRLDQLAGLLH